MAQEQRQLSAARSVWSRTCLRRTDSSSGPISRVAPSAAQPAAMRNRRSASSFVFTHQQARANPSARRVSAHAFRSREPWPRCCAAGSTTNWSIAPSILGSASPSWLGMVVANPTTRWPSVATRTRNAACGGRSMAARQESVISVSETEVSISSASSAGHWVAQDRRWSSAMLAASVGQARRTESAIGPPEAEVTGAMLSGLYPSSRGRR